MNRIYTDDYLLFGLLRPAKLFFFFFYYFNDRDDDDDCNDCDFGCSSCKQQKYQKIINELFRTVRSMY